MQTRFARAARYLGTILGIIILFSGVRPTGPTPAPRVPVAAAATAGWEESFPSMLLSEIEWLMSAQMPGGAIAQTPDHQLVIPYFANLAAEVLLQYAPGRVKDYLLWYLEHLNDPDRWGLSGTIYDYQLRAGVLEPTMNYDSADSYAATFLSLVRGYVWTTGDAGFAGEHLSSLRMVASVITELQDRDGLVWAKPNHRVKYLMDNAENYRGLRDWQWLLEHLGLFEEAEEAGRKADLVKQGLETRLWDAGIDQYYWSDGLLGRKRVRTGRWYPDYVSQLYPLLNGLMEPDDPRALNAYSRLAGDFPRWHQGELPDRFPWALVAYAAALIGDKDTAREYLASVAAGFASSGRPYPWYILESAYTIRTIKFLGD